MSGPPARARLAVAGLAVSVAGLMALYAFTHVGGEVELEDGVTAFALPRSFAHDSGGLPAGGELFVSPGGCLAAKNDSGAFFLGLPAGSHPDDTGRAVITGRNRQTGQGQRFAVGDLIEGDGTQNQQAGWRDEVTRRWTDAPRACLDNLSGYLSITETDTA